MKKMMIPDLLLQFPFFCFNTKKNGVSCKGEDFSVDCNVAMGAYEQDMVNCLFYFRQLGIDCISAADISAVAGWEKTQKINACLKKIAKAEYKIFENKEHSVFPLVSINEKGHTSNKKFCFEFSDFVQEKMKNYCWIDLEEYFALPQGLPRRAYEFFENKRRKGINPIAMGWRKLCSWLPITNKNESQRKFQLRALLGELALKEKILRLDEKGETWEITLTESKTEAVAETTRIQRTERIVIAENPMLLPAAILENVEEKQQAEASIPAENRTTQENSLVEENTRMQESVIDRKISDILQRLSKLQEENAQLRAENAKLASELLLLKKMPAVPITATTEPKKIAVDAAANSVEDSESELQEAQAERETREYEALETELLPPQNTSINEGKTPVMGYSTEDKTKRDYDALTPEKKALIKQGVEWIMQTAPDFDKKLLRKFPIDELVEYLPNLPLKYAQQIKVKPVANPAGWILKAIEKKYMPHTEKSGGENCTVNAPRKGDQEKLFVELDAKQQGFRLGEKLLEAWHENKNTIDAQAIIAHCEQYEKLPNIAAIKEARFRYNNVALEAVAQIACALGFDKNASLSLPEAKLVYKELQELAASKASICQKTLSDVEVFNIQGDILAKLPTIKESMGDQIGDLWLQCDENAIKFAIEICHICGLNGESEQICDQEFSEGVTLEIWK